jgi:hypothetical protein
MQKIKLFFSENSVKIFKIQIFIFFFFILISQLYGLDSEAHIYYNQPEIIYNFHGLFSLFMVYIFGLLLFLCIAYPFLLLIELIIIYRCELFNKTKLWLILISILLYFFSIISLIYLYSIEQHQGFLERVGAVAN